jgi:hypothetical protein
MEGNVDWPKVVFQQSMDDLLFILDTMFAKSITPHVSTNTQQQMTFHLITYHTSCFNKYTTADDISPYHISQLLFQQIHNSRWHFTLSHITKAKYSRWLHWKVCSVFRSSRNSTFLSFTRSFHVHISAFLFSWFIIFNATFNNISVISWQSVLLVEETGVPGENHWLVASHWQTLSHNVLSSTPRHKRGSNSQL